MGELQGTGIEKLRELYRIDKRGFCQYFDIRKATPYIQSRPVTDASGSLAGARISQKARTRYDCTILKTPIVGVEKIISICHKNYERCRAYAAEKRAKEGGRGRVTWGGDRKMRERRGGL